MRRGLAFAAGAAVLLAASAAFPCGASFGNNVTVEPHQDIIVVWKDGAETYVFQPIFCGTSTDFGLILPVPAPLSQNPALVDQQAFTTAAALSEPTKRRVVQPAGGISCGGGSAGVGGSKNAAVDTTTVVASGRVGFLDFVVLKSDTTSSLTDWLNANGYPYSSDSASVFAYYVQKGWYFLAFRISPQAAPAGGTICQALGPVALSFPTPTPVIPSRMAVAGSQATTANSTSGYIAWRIFGITHGDTQLALVNDAYNTTTLWYSGAIGAGDVPALGGLAESGDRLTRWTLRFYGGSSYPDDVALNLATAQDYRGTEDVIVYDDSACSLSGRGRSAQSALLTLFGLALVGLVCWRRWR